jgi:RNA polymerase sigma-70 factor (ECF subfamily)
VVNAAVDAAKRHGRELSLDALQSAEAGEELQLEGWLADPNPGPEEMAGQAEMQEMVRAALERLSPEQRAAIVLRYYLAYSEAEMAQALGCPPGTIKSRLSGARARLSGWLAHLRPVVPLAPSHGPVQGEANPVSGGEPCVAKK